MSIFKLEFITPLFSRGAYEDRPEVRSPSIRGQLHWWFRALGGSYDEEQAIFGSVHHRAVASRVVVRVGNVQGMTGEAPTLPHKSGGRASQKACFLPGTKFELHLLSRLGGLTDRHSALFGRALETWLLAGSLGLRSTRGAGSFLWHPVSETSLCYPANWATYETRCISLMEASSIRFALLGALYDNPETARRVITDTLGGPEQESDMDDLRRLNWPLGDVSSRRQRDEDPSRRERKTSPLRLRVAGMGKEYRIVALWDGRIDVTGNLPQDLPGIIRLLAQRKPALGEQLAQSELGR